jgi:5-(carboxyamino)imidazole ribonucleotide synthase
VAPFARVDSEGELHAALEELGYPAVVKTAAFGYDGKGQVIVESPAQVSTAWSALNTATAIVEAFVDLQCELSVVAARRADGTFAHYGAIENIHRNHILDVSIAPARVDVSVAARAVELAHRVLNELQVVGVLCVEFFLTTQGELLVNEMAPRPHNSGHLTVDAAITSQFEQQLRAVCGLPLGSPDLICPAVMVNLLGDLWSQGEPDWAAACAVPTCKLHLYGKREARPGRKMGHMTVLADSADVALEKALRVRSLLSS